MPDTRVHVGDTHEAREETLTYLSLQRTGPYCGQRKIDANKTQAITQNCGEPSRPCLGPQQSTGSPSGSVAWRQLEIICDHICRGENREGCVDRCFLTMLFHSTVQCLKNNRRTRPELFFTLSRKPPPLVVFANLTSNIARGTPGYDTSKQPEASAQRTTSDQRAVTPFAMKMGTATT